MKSLTQHLATAAIALLAVNATISESQAAKVTLDGYGHYEYRTPEKYYLGSGPKQGGRYRYLGEGYYRKITIGVDYITNRSGKRSGDLSLEFWAMPYYKATTGITLLARAKDPLGAGKSYKDAPRDGRAVSLGRRRFPEINIWEYTRKGWKFRDALSFTRKNLL